MARFAVMLTFGDHDARLAVRPRHRAYLERLLREGKLHESGPWADDSGALLIYEAENEAAARALLAADPYSQTPGVIADQQVKEWTVVFSSKK